MTYSKATTWKPNTFQDLFPQLAFDGANILDIGNCLRHRWHGTPDNCSRLIMDYDASTNPDVVGDVCSMNKEWTEVFDTVLAVSLLEHVYDPFKAAAELHRVLKPGGLLFGGVPFIFPYHASPGHYKDYWRFSEDGIEELLTKFDSVDIFAKRSVGNTASKFMPRRLSWMAKPLLNFLDKKASKFQVSYYYFLAKKNHDTQLSNG